MYVYHCGKCCNGIYASREKKFVDKLSRILYMTERAD